MANKKHSRVLFEVVQGDPKKLLGVPGWFGPQGGKPAATAAPGDSGPAQQAIPPQYLRNAVVSVGAGRLTVTLGKRELVLATIAVLVLLVAVFFLGRRSAATPAVAPTTGEPARPTLQAAREKGSWYLIVQDRVNSEQQARALQQHLHDKGIEVTVERRSDRVTFFLKDLTGFKSRDVPELAERIRQIEQIGSARPLGYDFRKPFAVQEK